MKLDELTIGDIKQLKGLLESPQEKTVVDGGIKIIILQRGWVMVGRFSQQGTECKLTNAAVIRNWGTSKGLGEIAEGGPTSSTKLDPVPTVTYHELTAIAAIDCEESKWKDHL